jgi:hypothetical protein
MKNDERKEEGFDSDLFVVPNQTYILTNSYSNKDMCKNNLCFNNNNLNLHMIHQKNDISTKNSFTTHSPISKNSNNRNTNGISKKRKSKSKNLLNNFEVKTSSSTTIENLQSRSDSTINNSGNNKNSNVRSKKKNVKIINKSKNVLNNYEINTDDVHTNSIIEGLKSIIGSGNVYKKYLSISEKEMNITESSNMMLFNRFSDCSIKDVYYEGINYQLKSEFNVYYRIINNNFKINWDYISMQRLRYINALNYISNKISNSFFKIGISKENYDKSYMKTHTIIKYMTSDMDFIHEIRQLLDKSSTESHFTNNPMHVNDKPFVTKNEKSTNDTNFERSKFNNNEKDNCYNQKIDRIIVDNINEFLKEKNKNARYHEHLEFNEIISLFFLIIIDFITLNEDYMDIRLFNEENICNFITNINKNVNICNRKLQMGIHTLINEKQYSDRNVYSRLFTHIVHFNKYNNIMKGKMINSKQMNKYKEIKKTVCEISYLIELYSYTLNTLRESLFGLIISNITDIFFELDNFFDNYSLYGLCTEPTYLNFLKNILDGIINFNYDIYPSLYIIIVKLTYLFLEKIITHYKVSIVNKNKDNENFSKDFKIDENFKKYKFSELMKCLIEIKGEFHIKNNLLKVCKMKTNIISVFINCLKSKIKLINKNKSS